MTMGRVISPSSSGKKKNFKTDTRSPRIHMEDLWVHMLY